MKELTEMGELRSQISGRTTPKDKSIGRFNPILATLSQRDK
jgi:hypothetical protein